MIKAVDKGHLPEIIVGDAEYENLSDLAAAALSRAPGAAAPLLFELERATVVRADEVPADVVRLGSTVTFRADEGALQKLTLVLPAAADITESRISVLTPIGAALLGLREDQSIMWSARDGKRHRLQVLSVQHGSGAGC